MTLKEIIDFTDRVKPNAYDEAVKTVWLNELEYAIQADIFGRTEDFTAHDWSESGGEEEMLVPEPWQKVYYTWLEARIDAANGEWDEYANAMTLYNTFMGEYERYYARTYLDEK